MKEKSKQKFYKIGAIVVWSAFVIVCIGLYATYGTMGLKKS